MVILKQHIMRKSSGQRTWQANMTSCSFSNRLKKKEKREGKKGEGTPVYRLYK